MSLLQVGCQMINTGMILESYKSLKDKSIKLIFETQEVNEFTKDIISEIITLQGKFLQVAIIDREQPIEANEIPQIPLNSSVTAPKSGSKQVRDRLYILWSKTGKTGIFEDYYKKYINFQLDKIQKEIDKND